MCAINGCSWEDRSLIERMNSATIHRGPDAGGIFSSGVSFGHNRLAILDLSVGAQQPMTSNDGRYTIIYNGELYNFKSLKEELSGYQFKTAGDTEVVLAAWAAWGQGCLERFNGMFAFALWDSHKEEIFLVRDPMGIKPLYWTRSDDGGLIFSSEIKGLLEAPIPRVLDKVSFNAYMRLLYVPGPRTMFEGISKLQPGHLLRFRNSEIEVKPYKAYSSNIQPKENFAERASQLWGVFQSGVVRQLVSDRPVGLYLSGGLDSNALLAACVEGGVKPKTFTVEFEVRNPKDDEKFNADSKLAKESARHFGIEHESVVFGFDEVVPTLEQSVAFLDEPNWNPTSLPMMKLSSFAKKQIAVALAGDGGDELFGGYERYRKSLILSFLRKVPGVIGISRLHKKLAPLRTSENFDRVVQFMFQKEADVASAINPIFNDREVFVDEFSKQFLRENASFEEDFMEFDLHTWLVDESLARTDKMSMSSGLEVRVPILDLELVTFASKLKVSDKVRLFDRKVLFRKSLEKHVPEFILNQPKRGWFSPAAKWLREEAVQSFVKDVLSAEFNQHTKDLFDWEYLRNLLDEHSSGQKYALHILWPVVVFQLWARRFAITL